MAEAEAQLGNDHEACVWLGKLRQNRIADGGAVTLARHQLNCTAERASDYTLYDRWHDIPEDSYL